MTTTDNTTSDDHSPLRMIMHAAMMGVEDTLTVELDDNELFFPYLAALFGFAIAKRLGPAITEPAVAEFVEEVIENHPDAVPTSRYVIHSMIWHVTGEPLMEGLDQGVVALHMAAVVNHVVHSSDDPAAMADEMLDYIDKFFAQNPYESETDR